MSSPFLSGISWHWGSGGQLTTFNINHYGDSFCQEFTQYIFPQLPCCAPFSIGGSSVPSWGFECIGQERLAIILMSIALCGKLDNVFDYIDCYSFKDEYGEEDSWAHKHIKEWPRIKDTILKLHKQFSTEVLTHLPDQWTMSRKFILNWIAKQERKRRKKR